jgi:hypothetical protein
MPGNYAYVISGGFQMTAALAVAPRRSEALELGFVDVDGEACREPLATCWRRSFESAVAVRRFSSYKGQSNFPGLWWSATTGDHVGFESWLERDHAMMLDFDVEVVGFASQPFWLHWRSGMDWRRHAPDFFARLSDGTGVVVDVRADDNVDADAAAAFSATAEACKCVGWRYRRVGALDRVLAANVRWLSGYRHPRCLHVGRAARLCEVFSTPRPLLAGVARVGDPVAVLPVLFHLLWRGRLAADLTATVLCGSSIVSVRDTG